MYSDLLLTPTGCDDESARLLSVRLATSAIRRGIPEADLLEALTALGLAKPAAPLLREGRSAYGRVRPKPQRCPSGEHAMPATGGGGCLPCASRERAQAQTPTEGAPEPAAAVSAPVAAMSEPPAPRMCRCKGRKHVMHLYPSGKYQCAVAANARRSRERAKARAVREAAATFDQTWVRDVEEAS